MTGQAVARTYYSATRNPAPGRPRLAGSHSCDVCVVGGGIAVASDRYLGALYDANAGHIHPLNYTLGLAAAAERAGARIFEGTRAVDFTGRSPVRVRTPDGEVRCQQLVLCGNVYLGPTAPQLQARIMAVGTCMVASEPLGQQRAQALITNNAAVADMNWVLDYFRRSSDHRLLFG